VGLEVKVELKANATRWSFHRYYLRDKTIEAYLKLRPVSDLVADLLDYRLFRFGSLDFEEIASYLIPTVNYYGIDEALKFLDITKLPEEFYVKLKENLQIIKFLVMLENIREK
jgi:hypothetical protein